MRRRAQVQLRVVPARHELLALHRHDAVLLRVERHLVCEERAHRMQHIQPLDPLRRGALDGQLVPRALGDALQQPRRGPRAVLAVEQRCTPVQCRMLPEQALEQDPVQVLGARARRGARTRAARLEPREEVAERSACVRGVHRVRGVRRILGERRPPVVQRARHMACAGGLERDAHKRRVRR